MSFEDHSLAELRDLAEVIVTVAAASEVGIFHALAGGARRPDEVADARGLDRRAVRILLPALADLGLLVEEGERFRLTERAARELGDPDAPEYQGRGLPLWLENLRGWTALPEVLESGRPALGGGEPTDRKGLARYMAGMAATPKDRLHRVVDACLERAPSARTALDLGGGPGMYSRAFIERGLEATLVDRRETVDFVRDEYRLGEVEGLRLVGADFMEEPLPEGPFDVVLVSNVIHIYPAERNRELMRKVGAVVRPGGVVAVQDFIRERSARAARFALVMLLRTEGGDTYSMEKIEEWLGEAGFGEARIREADTDRHIVTALRA